MMVQAMPALILLLLAFIEPSASLMPHLNLGNGVTLDKAPREHGTSGLSFKSGHMGLRKGLIRPHPPE